MKRQGYRSGTWAGSDIVRIDCASTSRLACQL